MPRDEIISNDVLDAALRLQEFCRARDWRFCFIGGLAVQKWGEPRVTDDVDLTLLPGRALRLCTAGDDALDWRYIHEQLRPLLELKEAPELFGQLESAFRLRRANRPVS